MLSRRRIEVSAEARDRIARCTDLERLATWIDRALSAGSIEEVLQD